MKNKNSNTLEKKVKLDTESKSSNIKKESKSKDEIIPTLSISEKLKRKRSIIKDLRNLLNNNNDDSLLYKSVKKLQDEWKNIGFVDSNKEKSLWSSYSALLDIFYNNRSIYFELKDLDSKKNLEIKNDLCVQAENLLKSTNLKDTILKLNQIHIKFKETGPVPIKDKDKVWNRLKNASDKIYKNKKEFFVDIKKTLEQNLEKKKEILKKISSFDDLKIDNISEWKIKTSELLNLKDEWEKIGGVPKKDSKIINKEFWLIFKTFFNRKSNFFKKMESSYNDNLELKLKLIEKVEILKESNNWKETTNEIQSIQKEWKKVGKVPIKMKDKIYKKFKTSCDYFFERKRLEDKDLINEYNSNYDLKSDICNKIFELSKSDEFSSQVLLELQNQYNKIGPVAKDKLKHINDMFDKSIKSIDKLIKSMNSNDTSIFNFNIELKDILNKPPFKDKLRKKEKSLLNKINKIESEVKNLKVNVDFLKTSENANNLKKDYDKQILEASNKVDVLKNQLHLVKINMK